MRSWGLEATTCLLSSAAYDKHSIPDPPHAHHAVSSVLEMCSRVPAQGSLVHH